MTIEETKQMIRDDIRLVSIKEAKQMMRDDVHEHGYIRAQSAAAYLLAWRIFLGVAVLLLCLVVPAVASQPAHDGLDELNAMRTAHGLRPYKRCAWLTAGAKQICKWRADRGISGHTRNDFSALPVGCKAPAAGCGVSQAGGRWATCCMWDSYQYAGAAWCLSKDGRRRYMHIFVSNRKGP